MAQIQEKAKWITIKILSNTKDEIETLIKKTGRFVNVPDFVEYALRRELEAQRRSR